MLTPEQIKDVNNQRTSAIHSRFNDIVEINPNNASVDLTKSEDVPTTFFTKASLTKFKNDLYKGIEEGTVTEDSLEKAQIELESLSKATTIIGGVETEVFVKL
jgi:hypothetical protein